jgi:hypothetical protein
MAAIEIPDLEALARAGANPAILQQLRAALDPEPTAGSPVHPPSLGPSTPPTSEPAGPPHSPAAVATEVLWPWRVRVGQWAQRHRRPLVRAVVAAGLVILAWRGWRRYRLQVACMVLWWAQVIGVVPAPVGTAALIVAGGMLAWHWRAGLWRWGRLALIIGLVAAFLRVFGFAL